MLPASQDFWWISNFLIAAKPACLFCNTLDWHYHSSQAVWAATASLCLKLLPLTPNIGIDGCYCLSLNQTISLQVLFDSTSSLKKYLFSVINSSWNPSHPLSSKSIIHILEGIQGFKDLPVFKGSCLVCFFFSITSYTSQWGCCKALML